MLKQNYVQEKIDKLEGWLNSADEIARDGKSVQEEAERIIGAMTDEEAAAFWNLYAEAEDILMHVGQRQMGSSDANLDYEEMRGVAIFVWARTIIDYDPTRGDLAGYLMTASRPHWRQYLRSISPSAAPVQRRRVGRLLRQVRVQKKTHRGREPTLEEKIDYVKQRNAWMRGKTQQEAAAVIQEVESAKKPTSLQETLGDEEGDRTLHDILPAGPQGSIDTEAVARKVAAKTGREELLDRLLGEDPSPASLSRQKARLIYLEREARGADLEQLAWEHSTTPYVVAQVEHIYDVDVSIEEVARYKGTQGYDSPLHNGPDGCLTGEDIWEICLRSEEETYAEIAEDYPLDPRTIGGVVRGETYPDADRPETGTSENTSDSSDSSDSSDQEPAQQVLTDDEVVEICERYEEESTSYRALAEDYPVGRTTISRIVRGETYQHVDRPEPRTRPLSPEQVREICRRYEEEDTTYAELAEDYPASDAVIGCVIRGETYTDIDRPDLGPAK